MVEGLPEIADSLVVHLEDDSGGVGELLLFVALQNGAVLDDALEARIAGELRRTLSPRHVPDAVIEVPSVPRTLSGKKLEVPVKRILTGTPADLAASRGALATPRPWPLLRSLPANGARDRTSTVSSMRVMQVTWRAFGRTAKGGVAVLLALFLTFSLTAGTGGAAQGAPIEPGIGSALAQTALVGPSFANLSLAFAFGRSIAGHTNSVAQASSQAIDLGQVGASLAGQGCDGGDPTLPDDQQPHEVRVDSRDAVATKDEDETFMGGLPMHKHAEANPTPFGKAVTTTAPFGVAGVLEIGGGIATSTSGLVEGGVREAKAVTDISGIKLIAGVGLVELSGLHWEAIWSSRTNGVTGSFTIARRRRGSAAPHQ